MKIVKKYTAVMVRSSNVDDEVKVNLTYGNIEGHYYSRTNPKEEFDTQEEAIEYAFKRDKYARWAIIPIMCFDDLEY